MTFDPGNSFEDWWGPIEQELRARMSSDDPEAFVRHARSVAWRAFEAGCEAQLQWVNDVVGEIERGRTGG